MVKQSVVIDLEIFKENPACQDSRKLKENTKSDRIHHIKLYNISVSMVVGKQTMVLVQKQCTFISES